MKFRCDRDALSEALQTVQRGVSSRPGIPALTGVLLDAAEGGVAHAHDHGPRGLGAARGRRVGERAGDRARSGAAARRHREVALERPGRPRGGPDAGTHPLRGLRGHAPAAARRGFPRAAGAGRGPRPGRRGRLRRGGGADRPRGEPRRGPARPHRRARRGEPRGLHARRDRLVPAGRARARRDRRRRGEGDRARAGPVRGRPRRRARREGHASRSWSTRRRSRSVPAGSRSRRG